MVQQMLNHVRETRQRLEIERVRRDADLIRARCQNFAQFVREAWHVIEPSTELRWNWHLEAMCDHLEAISRGTLHPRLIINIPPGHSKSTIVSVMWQAWEMGPLGKPGIKYLSTSYEKSNADRDSRKTRDLIMSEWFQELWPLELARTAEDDWETEGKGTRVAVAFSSITAKRGDRFIIDDPHSLDGAESEAERTKAVRRFVEGGQNRLNDQQRSAIVIVMQRLHQGDLTGALLERQLGYIHLMLPMEFEPERRCVTPIFKDPRSLDGELLDPVRFPPRAVQLLKQDNDYMWAGQYQQRPTPREGGMFKVDRIRKVSHIEEHVRFRTRGWDIAGSTKKTSPFTAGGRLALGASGKVYIEQMVRERAEIEVAERLIVTTCREDGPMVRQSLPQDPGQAGKSQKVALAGKLAGLDFMFTPETGTKEDRAIPFAAQVNSEMVYMIEAPWNSALEEELRNFPSSTFKDQVDSLSRAYTEVAKFIRDNDDSGDTGMPIFIRRVG